MKLIHFIQVEAENAMDKSHPDKYKDGAIKILPSEIIEYISVADVKGSTSN